MAYISEKNNLMAYIALSWHITKKMECLELRYLKTAIGYLWSPYTETNSAYSYTGHFIQIHSYFINLTPFADKFTVVLLITGHKYKYWMAPYTDIEFCYILSPFT